MIELWKAIPFYEGIYEASNIGRIRSTEGKVTSSKRYERRIWKQRVLRQKVTTNKRGRQDARVDLWKDGKRKTYLVARLIALTWCAGFQDGLTVNHIDGNTLNNSCDNLEWVTLTQNIRHAIDNNLTHYNKIIILENAATKEQKCFMSEQRASYWLGRNHAYIHNCIKKGRTAKSLNGNLFTIKTIKR